MATKYAMITYGIPGSEPVLAELGIRSDKTMVLGHGYLWKLIEMGVTVTPLVLATPERIVALETLLNYVDFGFDELETGGDLSKLAIMRAMLAEMKGGATDE